MEKYKEKDLLTSAIQELSVQQPKLAQVVLIERDQFLSKVLQSAGVSKVVAVVGIGHLNGIESYWGDSTINMKNLLSIPEKSPFQNTYRAGGFLGAISVLGYLAKRFI